MTPSAAVSEINPAGRSRILLLCDHATNIVPEEVAGGDLGLPPQEMARHIAWDIGAAGVTEALSGLLDAAALLTRFSRLVIDPNRGEDDPTLVMRLYDGTLVPGEPRGRPAPRSSAGSRRSTAPTTGRSRRPSSGSRPPAGRPPSSRSTRSRHG